MNKCYTAFYSFLSLLFFIGNSSAFSPYDFKSFIDSDSLYNNFLISILIKQVQNGQSALYDNSFDIITYRYTKKDLDCIVPLITNVLMNAGYQQPTKNEFAIKIKQLFGRTIDYNTKLKYLYVNMEDASDRKHKYYRADNSIEIHPFGIFIIKEQRFITQLYAIPELIDYKTLFPDVLKEECKINKIQQDKNGDEVLLYFWKDDKELNIKTNLKTIITRNKYLFNNDTTQLKWLMQNDELFMKSLIRTYKYSFPQ